MKSVIARLAVALAFPAAWPALGRRRPLRASGANSATSILTTCRPWPCRSRARTDRESWWSPSRRPMWAPEAWR